MTMERLKITIRPEQLKWIDDMVDNDVWASRSHAVRYLITYFQKLKGVEV